MCFWCSSLQWGGFITGLQLTVAPTDKNTQHTVWHRRPKNSQKFTCSRDLSELPAKDMCFFVVGFSPILIPKSVNRPIFGIKHFPAVSHRLGAASVEPGTSLMHPLASQWDFEAALHGHLLHVGEPHAWTSGCEKMEGSDSRWFKAYEYDKY